MTLIYHYAGVIRKSLILKTILISVISGILIVAAWTAVFYYTLSNHSRQQQRNEINSFLIFCQKSYPVPLFNLDRSTIQHLNDAVMMNRSMRMVTIYDRDIIYERSIISDETKRGSVDSWKMVSGPVEFGGEIIGKIELLYDESVINRDIVRGLINTIVSTLSIVTVLLMILYFFARRLLVKPIVDLSGTARSIAEKNDYSIRVDFPSDDEVGYLYRGFNFMLENIQHRDSELRTTTAYLHNIIESMPSMLITIDKEFRVGLWNRAAEMVTGIRPDDMIGRILINETHVFDDYIQSFERVMLTNTPVHFYHRELGVQHDGKSRNYKNLFIYPLLDEDVKGAVIRIDDITELEKMENQLRQIQKMETLGTIAGGIAHDFNNMLGGIVGTLSLIRYRMGKGRVQAFNDLSGYISTMEESALRARDMASQLLSLSRQQDSRVQNVDLTQSLGHVLRICQNTFDKCIIINYNVNQGPSIVSGDETQLQQVFLNLCVNAMHAMTIMRPENETDGGILVISLDKIHADRFFRIKHPDSEEIDYWIISVADNGVGMDSSTIDKIFEPFYTTKSDHHGTGLGLSVVNSIVKQHGGFIDVYSEIGTGSIFKIYLPAITGEETGVAAKADDEIIRGSGLVLVIDDEVSIRELTDEILVECGYSVITAENGIRGLEIYRERSNEINAVVLDMMMPGMGGLETIEELKKIKASVRILGMSGYRSDRVIESLKQRGVTMFLEKPFSMKDLAYSVHCLITNI